MPPRRGAPSPNSLGPPQTATHPGVGPSSPAHSSRSVSPSNGFTQFLAKPTKWFNRSGSTGTGRPSISSSEPRSSTSSSGRKHKISHPTDPRPILENLPQPTHGPHGLTGASRSVLDLSLVRSPTSFDGQSRSSPRTPSSPSHPAFSKGLGDLRNLSRKPWSKSADDLGKLPSSAPTLSPLDTTSFREKIDHYRGQNDGSLSVSSAAPSPTTSPDTSSLKNYPFPVITTSEPISSSPPQRTGLMSSGSSPVHTNPSPLSSATSGSSSHVHSRSHSFTPRLPSKLSAPKTGGLIPPSPKRKGSASSEREPPKDREREKNTSTGSSGSGRSPFSFTLGGGGGSGHKGQSSLGSANDDTPSSSLSSAVSPAPPTIIEPSNDEDDHRAGKRASQVVYHSGFINRLVDFSPAVLNARANHSYMSGGGGFALSKGWKPFKLVLRGSKLYFYKPPNDRGAAIKELFPTELLAVLEEEGLTDVEQEPFDGDEDRRSRSGKEREDTRRKRAYWGRATHPGLQCVDGRLEKGSFEALVHEAVFSTTFLESAEVSSTDQTSAPREEARITARYRTEWRDFSAAVLLALPSLTDRGKFESEFMRCCSYLLNGAEEGARAGEAARVRWLADQYLDYYDVPSQKDAWDAWREELIPESGVASEITDPSRASPAGRASPHPSLTPGTAAAAETETSPNVGTFSPRPADSNKLQSFAEALNDIIPPQDAHPSRIPLAALRTALKQDGLSRDLMFSLDVQLIARSLFVLHEQLLHLVPDTLRADLCLCVPDSASGGSASTSEAPNALSPFIGSEEHPHWLTRLILIQILVPESPGSQHAEDRGQPSSRTHSRSEVLSIWAQIGELCRRNGDACSWRAIQAALCSRPVARLDKVWKRVHTDALSIVQSWVALLRGAPEDDDAQRSGIPWAGDIHAQIQKALRGARVDDLDEWRVSGLVAARDDFERLRTMFAQCPKGPSVDGKHDPEDVEILVEYWRRLRTESGGGGAVASKFVRVDQFMSLSLAAEPRRRGLYESHYWSRVNLQSRPHPLTALLFPEPLPTVSFIDRAMVLRGRLESNTSLSNVTDLQYIREGRVRLSGDRSHELSRGGGVDLGGTILPVFNGELLLLVQPGEFYPSSRPASRAPSRPPSSTIDGAAVEKAINRNPSIRVTPSSSHGLERKASALRRNSLPSISQRTSIVIAEVSSEKPLRVVVQAGTLDRLVDMLVHGLNGVSVSVADDNGEMPLNAAKTKEVKVDVDEFAQIWWSTFRSFLTPQVFFEFLQKRYIGARVKSQTPSSAEVSNTVETRSDILRTMTDWINVGGGAQDALDDLQLYETIRSFLEHPTEHHLLQGISQDDSDYHDAVSTLDTLRLALETSFFSQTMRPSTRLLHDHDNLASGPATSNFGADPPNIDQLGAEELVNNLDSMASAAFRNVTQEDLFVTADILEVQSADRTGWFLPREPSSIADEVEVQSICSYILEIEPSSMISELSQGSLYRLLPPSIRSCIRAFGLLRKWLVANLVPPRLGLRTRQARMELMLRAIEVCRLRNAEPGSTNLPFAERVCIRSFVEAVITSAILGIESRFYHRAWQNVAIARGTSCESLTSLLSKPAVSSVNADTPLMVDMGWVLERMLEIISTPDILESTAPDKLSLVNVEKRRSLYALINPASGLGVLHRSRQRRSADRRDLERLNNIEKDVNMMHFDLRAIREDAHREAMQAGALAPSLAKRNYRPFQSLVTAQQEKNKRDKYLRDRLIKEKRQEQQRHDRREEYLSKAMNPRRQVTPAQKQQHRNKKSVSSAFFQFMRPISSAFISDSLSVPGPKRTAAELDFVPSQKPSLVLSVVNAQVAQFINNERSFTFQLDTDDGGHYLLQAVGKSEMKKWMDVIERVSKMAAKRRLTYLGQNTKAPLSDHLLSSTAVSQGPRAVYGVELETLLQREAVNGEVLPGTIPSVVERLISEVEERGLTEVGIYRVAGAHSEVNSYRDALNRGEWPITSTTDINAVCDLIKSWFRVLPGGTFPTASYTAILEAAADNIDLDTRLSNIREVVHALPEANFDLLKRLIEHLERVTDYEENNHMTADSLATVFSPNLLRSPNNDLGLFFANMSAGHRVTKMLISHFHTIFDTDVEQEQELDMDQDDVEFEPPIMEEDEDDADDGLLDPEAMDDTSFTPISCDPPVLDLNISSPHSLHFTIPSG